MTPDEMREIASMLHEILDNCSTFDELKERVEAMASCLNEDADDLEDEK